MASICTFYSQVGASMETYTLDNKGTKVGTYMKIGSVMPMNGYYVNYTASARK